jgi:hypothetical protein
MCYWAHGQSIGHNTNTTGGSSRVEISMTTSRFHFCFPNLFSSRELPPLWPLLLSIGLHSNWRIWQCQHGHKDLHKMWKTKEYYVRMDQQREVQQQIQVAPSCSNWIDLFEGEESWAAKEGELRCMGGNHQASRGGTSNSLHHSTSKAPGRNTLESSSCIDKKKKNTLTSLERLNVIDTTA